jgi:hypothetical protein
VYVYRLTRNRCTKYSRIYLFISCFLYCLHLYHVYFAFWPSSILSQLFFSLARSASAPFMPSFELQWLPAHSSFLPFPPASPSILHPVAALPLSLLLIQQHLRAAEPPTSHLAFSCNITDWYDTVSLRFLALPLFTCSKTSYDGFRHISCWCNIVTMYIRPKSVTRESNLRP